MRIGEGALGWRRTIVGWAGIGLACLSLLAGCQPAGGPASAVVPASATAQAPATKPDTSSRRGSPAATPTPETFGFGVVAGGLVNPRGLAFGPDGALYVAEAGTGGPRMVDLGRKRPHYVGMTGRVSVITPGQPPRPLISGLPAIVTAAHEEVGPAALAFVHGTLYLLTASGGWDVGDASFNSGLFRLGPTGSSEPVFDLTTFSLADPPPSRRQDPRADVQAGMPFGLTALQGMLYATDGSHEVVLQLTTDGHARRILEYPASDRALTGITAGPDGNLYLTEYVPGKVTRLSLDGTHTDAATGFALPIGVAFDGSGRLCVLEFVGKVTCLGAGGERTVLATGLTRPTSMTAGPDGALYIANGGHISENGEGEIVRVQPRPA